MLNPEKAAEYLKTVEIKEGLDECLKRIASLPASIRWIGFGLLNRKEDGTESTGTKWYELRSKAAEAMGTLSEDQRREMFAMLFPSIAGHVEAGWKLFERLPYQMGAGRRAFHAPGRTDLSASPRTEWVTSLLYATNRYEQAVDWWAAWVPYIGWGADSMGYLFAAAIDAGGDEGDAVYDILVASAKGEHEIGAMGRHVTRGLLTSSRPEGWEFMEKFLLAAQRQEGLRQVILETIDEAHPEAFRRMLHCILDNELLRFSATLRALDVWFGFGYDVETLTLKEGNRLIAEVLQFLEDDEARSRALESGGAQSAYLALCAAAYQDALAAVEIAARMLHDESAERRFAAVHCLNELHLQEARAAAVFALEDPDLRVAWHAFNVVRSDTQNPNLFEALEKFLLRLPKKNTELEPIVWPWNKQTTSVTSVGSALRISLGDRSPKQLIPYLPVLESYGRSELAELLAKQKKIDAESRKTLFALVGDSQEFVRDKAIAALEKVEITPDEAQDMEKLFSRKAGSLRRSVLTLLLKQKDESALASADRLLSVSNPPSRQAGLEVLQQLIKADRKPQECRASAERYRSRRTKPDDSEEKLLEAILDEAREIPTLENGLGLFRPEDCSPVIPPRTLDEILTARDKRSLLQKVGDALTGKKTLLVTDAPAACLKSLNKVLTKHKATPVMITGWDDQQREQILGDLTWLPAPNTKLSMDEDLPRLPLAELWESWWRDRPASERDADGFELLRLAASMHSFHGRYYHQKIKNTWIDDVLPMLFSPIGKEVERWTLIDSLIHWMLRMHFPAGAFDFLLDAIEITFSLIPPAEHTRKFNPDEWYDRGWRKNDQIIAWLNVLNQVRPFGESAWTEAHDRRLWNLLHWMDRPADDAPRIRPDLSIVIRAFKLGNATEADVMEQLIGPRVFERYTSRQFTELHMLTGRKPHALLNDAPELSDMVDRCRTRIIEIELHRGDMPTAASAPAISLRSLEGVVTLAKLLSVYGAREPFVRSGTDSQLTRKDVFSHLIRSTFPRPDDSVEQFAREMQAIKASPNRLVELAVFAPQWAKFVQDALEWPDLEEAVWWIHAHTKDQGWTVDQEIREEWNAQSSQLTPLSPENLLEGAVDVAWFHRVYEALGPERWSVLDSAAKYASGGGGHKRAQLFADAMLGRLTHSELSARIADKRNGDAVRSLGLLPVPNDHTRKDVLLQRYKIIQEFVRTSKQFGAQRQESEKKAAHIGMENLSRTAGYADPNRLQWAMEAEAVADLANGPITVTVEEVAVTLSINFLGKPDVEVLKAGKPLKTVPPKVKKDPAVAELFSRKKDIDRQGARMRLSLEQAMCRGDVFTGADLQELLAHPVLRPMLRALVFIGEDNPGLAGYPVDAGAALERHDGRCVDIAETAKVRIAHPYDLMQTEEWHLWQKECFLHERIQPFKQVFRELYVLTDAEQKENKYSVRYEGHQVMPRQSMALAGARGWVHSYEEGVRRTFHEEGLTAWLTFDQFFTTPAEVEGLTIQQVYFTKRGEWKPLDLSAVPPRIFSEAMRDVDLIVSVAHAGGVDPEASASTVEMRESLLRETLGWLKIGNVRFQSAHALIEGKLGVYSVHMGSAIVHRQPGGHLCIVPVHGQHRGRLFLPFADDDPKTAEVISKVLLLSKDEEIKDPVILEQILPRAH